MRKLMIGVLLLLLMTTPAVFAQDGPDTLDASYTWEELGFSISYPSAWGLAEVEKEDDYVVLDGDRATIAVTYANLFDLNGGYGDELALLGRALFDEVAAENDTTRFALEVVETDYGHLIYTSFDQPAFYALGLAVAENDDAFLVVIEADEAINATASAIYESITLLAIEDAASEVIAAGSIAVGDSVQGEISGGALSYDLIAAPGQLITIDLIADDPLTLDTTLLLLVDGVEYAFNDDGFDDGSYNSRLIIELPSASSYGIVAGRFDDASAGTFTLRVTDGDATLDLSDTPLDGGTVGIGERVRGDIDVQPIAFTLLAETGQTVTVELIADDPFALDTTLALLADGVQIDFSDDGYEDGTYNSRLYAVTLPPAQSYTLVAAPYDENYHGAFTLSVSAADPIPDVVEVGDVGAGQVVQGEIGPSDVVYRLTAEPGQFVSVEVIADPNSPLDPIVYLIADDEVIAENDDISDEDYNSRIDGIVLPTATTYSIRISRYGGIDTYGFTLSVGTGN